jgi:hypothetical protein
LHQRRCHSDVVLPVGGDDDRKREGCGGEMVDEAQGKVATRKDRGSRMPTRMTTITCSPLSQTSANIPDGPWYWTTCLYN